MLIYQVFLHSQFSCTPQHQNVGYQQGQVFAWLSFRTGFFCQVLLLVFDFGSNRHGPLLQPKDNEVILMQLTVYELLLLKYAYLAPIPHFMVGNCEW